jgi:hypothetical protein
MAPEQVFGCRSVAADGQPPRPATTRLTTPPIPNDVVRRRALKKIKRGGQSFTDEDRART